MSPPAAQLLFALCFVCIRPILTNLFSVEHFCPLNIRFNRALTALDVRGNALGGGSAALAEVVSKSQQIVAFCGVPVKQMRDDALVELDLEEQNIGACGAMVVAHLLEFSRALKSVDLRYNSIPDGGCQQLSAAVGNKSITLQLRPQEIDPMLLTASERTTYKQSILD